MKGIIISADVQSDIQLDLLVKATYNIPEVLGYKLGFSLTILYGLKYLSSVILKHCAKEIMYDHQKAGTDIPAMGKKFADAVRHAGADSVILFPLAGCSTAEQWIRECHSVGLKVLVGAYMTHIGFTTNEGGVVDSSRLVDLFDTAIHEGVSNFVIPGSPRRYESAATIANYIRTHSQKGLQFYAPGIGAQGGEFLSLTSAVGSDIIPIVGRTIYDSSDIAKATNEFIESSFPRLIADEG